MKVDNFTLLIYFSLQFLKLDFISLQTQFLYNFWKLFLLSLQFLKLAFISLWFLELTFMLSMISISLQFWCDPIYEPKEVFWHASNMAGITWYTLCTHPISKMYHCAPWKSVIVSWVASKGSKIWWLLWFPAQNNSCLNICNTAVQCTMSNRVLLKSRNISRTNWGSLQFHTLPS